MEICRQLDRDAENEDEEESNGKKETLTRI